MPRADKGLDRVIEFLEVNWTEKELKQLNIDVESILNRIKRNHKIGFATAHRKSVRKTYPNKHTYLVYKVKPRKRIVEVIDFGSTREKPLRW